MMQCSSQERRGLSPGIAEEQSLLDTMYGYCKILGRAEQVSFKGKKGNKLD